MTTQQMQSTINNRINELIKAGAKKELMERGYNEEEANNELYQAAICSLLGL